MDTNGNVTGTGTSNGDEHGQAVSVKEYVEQTERELSGEAYEDAEGNRMYISAKTRRPCSVPDNNQIDKCGAQRPPTRTIKLEATFKLNDSVGLVNSVHLQQATVRARVKVIISQTQEGRSSSASHALPRDRHNGGSSSSSRRCRASEEDAGIADPQKSQAGVYALDSLTASMERLWRNECSRLLPGTHKTIIDAYLTHIG